MMVSGAVAGIDVGFSKTRYSSAVCALRWDRNRVDWIIKRFRANNCEREAAIRETVSRITLHAVALDGPIRGGLDLIDEYRVAERNLTRLLWRRIGKPGQSNAPVGRRLNEETNRCARAILDRVDVTSETYRHGIHERFLLEAFPSSFLGLMLVDPSQVPSVRAKRSDTFYKALVENSTLEQLLEFLLPGRVIDGSLRMVTHHDDRAALVCAITALCAAAGKYCCVGDPKNGWIILPPKAFVQPWAHELLNENGRLDGSYQHSS
jgi:hypothetical protein